MNNDITHFDSLHNNIIPIKNNPFVRKVVFVFHFYNYLNNYIIPGLN